MTIPTILGLATGVPENRYRQLDIHDRWLRLYINSERARAIFVAAEIDARYSVLKDPSFLADEPGTKARNDLYMKQGRVLAAGVIRQALSQAGLQPADIHHLLVVSCTGFDSPGLDVMLAEDLAMRKDLRRSALIGMGCHAGLTGLDRATLELAARPDHYALLLAVEFGTLHFQSEPTLENMIASALFGDGLAAVVVGPYSGQDLVPRIKATMTHSDYSARDLMGFHISDTGYQIRLATRVPKILRSLAPGVVTDFLDQAGLKATDVRFWGIHPGGAKILDYLGQVLALQSEDLRFSRRVLRQYGNMSSVTIFFVLEEIIKHGRPRPGDLALLLAFGPGLTVELCLVEW